MLLAAVLLMPLAAMATSAIQSSMQAHEHETALTDHKVYVNGREAAVRGYEVEWRVMFLLDDICKAFDIRLNSGEVGAAIDTAHAFAGAVPETLPQKPAQADRAESWTVSVNGRDYRASAYGIDGRMYVGLTDIAVWLDCWVSQDYGAGRTDFDTARGFHGLKEAGVSLPRVRPSAAAEAAHVHPSEEEVYRRLAAAQMSYAGDFGAEAFAAWLSGRGFGDSLLLAPERRVENPSAVRPGDVAWLDGGRPVVILSTRAGHVSFAEAPGGRAAWGTAVTYTEFAEAFEHAVTRYPAA